jgi:glutaredoxin
MLRRTVLALLLAAATAAWAENAAQPPSQPVVMYATAWCPYCAQARAYFARNGIAYVEHDVEASAAAHAEFRRLGGRGVPLIFVGEERIDGFNELAFEFALLKASRPR